MATKRSLSLEDGNLSSTGLSSSRRQNYIDLDLTFTRKPSSGEIYKKTDASAVKQSVKTLLLTNSLEKPFEPYFGANIRADLFELIDIGNEYEIKRNIKNVIDVYEPRAEVQEVDLRLSPDENAVDVKVIFKIVNSEEVVNFTTNLSRLR